MTGWQNATVAVRSYLAGAVGVPVVVEVPNPRPRRFVLISAAGGRRVSAVTRHRLFMVDSWAESKLEAENLALLVQAAAENARNLLIGSAFIASGSVMGDLIDSPDPDSGAPRMRQNLDFIMRAV